MRDHDERTKEIEQVGKTAGVSFDPRTAPLRYSAPQNYVKPMTGIDIKMYNNSMFFPNNNGYHIFLTSSPLHRRHHRLPRKEWRRPRGRVVKHGCVLWRTTSNNRIWGCGQPSTELTTGNSGVKSWKQRRSSRGMLHDDDDNDDRRCRVSFSVLFQNS